MTPAQRGHQSPAGDHHAFHKPPPWALRRHQPIEVFAAAMKAGFTHVPLNSRPAAAETAAADLPDVGLLATTGGPAPGLRARAAAPGTAAT